MNLTTKPRLTLLAALIAGALATASSVAHDVGTDGAVYSIKIPYTSGDQISKVTKITDHPYVDQDNKIIYAEVSHAEMDAIIAAGLQVEIDYAETDRIQKFVNARNADIASGAMAASGSGREQPASIADGIHSCYRTIEQIYADFDKLAEKYPTMVQVKTLGPSWMGTQQSTPAPGTGIPNNSSSSFANLLVRFLPPSILQRFNLGLLSGTPPPIKAIVVGNFAKQNDATPRMVWTGGIHAREYAPQEVGMKYIEWLLDNYGKDANATMMVDQNQYHFIVHNPDGRKLAEQDASARQRKNTNYVSAACTTTNAAGVLNTLNSGVDLNRNYPFGWATGGSGGSDGNPCGETFRGVASASEPETQAVLNYIRGNWNQAQCRWEGGALPDGRSKWKWETVADANGNPVLDASGNVQQRELVGTPGPFCNPENRDNNGAGELDWQTGAYADYGGGMFIDLHSNARAVLWPWGVERAENGFNTHSPNNQGMATIAQRLAYHNNYSSQQLLSYNTEGTTKDAFYGFLGAPSYTVEMGRSFYETCEVFARETYPENFNGFHYLSRVLKRIYQLPAGPDTVDVKVAASVKAGEKILVTATVDDNRYRYSNAGQATIKPPPYPVVHNIRSAKLYVGGLPWEEGTKSVDMELSTSAQAKNDFLLATRLASVSFDTTGLAPGRHMVYVQGVNDSGQAGAVSAAFLEIQAGDGVVPPTPPGNGDGGGNGGGNGGGDGGGNGGGNGGGGNATGSSGGGGSFGWGGAMLGLLALAGAARRRRSAQPR